MQARAMHACAYHERARAALSILRALSFSGGNGGRGAQMAASLASFDVPGVGTLRLGDIAKDGQLSYNFAVFDAPGFGALQDTTERSR